MKLAFTLAASALLATVPITASPIIPNTAVGKKDTVIVSAATVSNIIHPTTTIVSLRPEVSEAADESDSDVDESDESDESDYTTSDSESEGDVSDDDASDDESTSSHLTVRQDGTCSGNSGRLCVDKDKCLCAECKSGSYFEDCKFTAITPDNPKAKRSVIPPSAANIVGAESQDYDSRHENKQTETPHSKKDLSDGSSSSESHLNFLTRRLRPLPEGYHCPHKSFMFGCKDDKPNECACYWRTAWSAQAHREIPVRDSDGTPLKRSLDGPSTSTHARAVLVEDEVDLIVFEEDFHLLPRDIFRRMIADDLHCATRDAAMRCSLTTEVCSCWKDGMRLDEQPVNGGSDWSWEKQRDEQKRKAEEEKAKNGAKRSLSPPSASASGLDGDHDFLPVHSLPHRSSHTAEYWKSHLPPTSHNRRGPQSHTADYWNHHSPTSSPNRRAPKPQELSQDDEDKAMFNFYSVTDPAVKRENFYGDGRDKYECPNKLDGKYKPQMVACGFNASCDDEEKYICISYKGSDKWFTPDDGVKPIKKAGVKKRDLGSTSSSTSIDEGNMPEEEFINAHLQRRNSPPPELKAKYHCEKEGAYIGCGDADCTEKWLKCYIDGNLGWVGYPILNKKSKRAVTTWYPNTPILNYYHCANEESQLTCDKVGKECSEDNMKCWHWTEETDADGKKRRKMVIDEEKPIRNTNTKKQTYGHPKVIDEYHCSNKEFEVWCGDGDCTEENLACVQYYISTDEKDGEVGKPFLRYGTEKPIKNSKRDVDPRIIVSQYHCANKESEVKCRDQKCTEDKLMRGHRTWQQTPWGEQGFWYWDDEKPIKNSKRGLDVDVQRRSPGHPGIKCTKPHEFPFCNDTRNITIETCSCASYQKNATTGFHYLNITGPAEKDDSDAPKHKRDLSDGVDDSLDTVDSGSYHFASDGKKRDSIEDINSFDSGSYGSYLPADFDDHNSMPIARRKDISHPADYHCSNPDWRVRCGLDENGHPINSNECRCYEFQYDFANKKTSLHFMDEATKNEKRDVSAGEDEADLVPPMRRLPGAKAARAEDYGYRCANAVANLQCGEDNGDIKCFCFLPVEKAIKDKKGDVSNAPFDGYHCANTLAKIICNPGQHGDRECWCYPPPEKAIKKNTKRDVSAGGDEADLVLLSELSGDLVARKLASSYYCTDPGSKIMCEQSKGTECWCYTDVTEETETGEPVTTMVKGDKPVQDSDSDYDSDSNSNNEDSEVSEGRDGEEDEKPADSEGSENDDKEGDEKPVDKKDVTSDSDSQATNVYNIISPTVDRRSGRPTSRPGYYCANPETKMLCISDDYCACVVKGENGKLVLDSWPVKDGEKPKRRDLDSDSVEPESDFETKFKRADPPLQFDVSVTLPAEVVKALGPHKRDFLPGDDMKDGKKRDVEVKGEVEEHLPKASVLERDANGVAPAMEKRKVNVQNHDHELFDRGNNGFGTRKVECKETGMIAGFCLSDGYCYCLQCRGFPDSCNFAQRKGVGDKRKRDLLDTIDGRDAEDDSLIEASEHVPAHQKRGLTDFLDNLLKARTFDNEVNTLPKPENMPRYIMHIYSQVIANNKNIQLTCHNSVGGFCFEDGCFCVYCEIALNNCIFRKMKGRRSKRVDNGVEQLGDDHDELLTIEGGDVHYGEKNDKRGGSGLHRTSSVGHPLTVGRRSPMAMPMPNNQAFLEKRNKGLECDNALGAFCFTSDECYCLRCKKFPDEGCSFDQRKFFTNSKNKRDSDATVSSEEDTNSETIDVVAPSTIPPHTALPSTITPNTHDVPHRNDTDHGRDVNIFARGRRADGFRPHCELIKDVQWGPMCGPDREDCHCMNCKDGFPDKCKWVDPEWVKDDPPKQIKKKKRSGNSSGSSSSSSSSSGGKKPVRVDGKRGNSPWEGSSAVKKRRSSFLGMHHVVPSFKAVKTPGVNGTVFNGTHTAVNETAGGAGRTEMKPVDKLKARDQAKLVQVPTKGKVGRSLEQEGQDKGTHRVAIPGAGEIDVDAGAYAGASAGADKGQGGGEKPKRMMTKKRDWDGDHEAYDCGCHDDGCYCMVCNSKLRACRKVEQTGVGNDGKEQSRLRR